MTPWPDLEVDRRAAEQARAELGKSADAQAIVQRAQKIKLPPIDTHAEIEPDDMRHSDPAETSAHGRPGWSG